MSKSPASARREESYMSTYRATPWGRSLLGADARQAGQFLQGHVEITGRAAVVFLYPLASS